MPRKIIPISFILILFLFGGAMNQEATAGTFQGSLNAGASGGPGGELGFTAANFASDLHLSARISLGYYAASAGDPYAARRTFINDNTNGTPQDSAHKLQFRFDLVFPIFHLGSQEILFFGGPRHCRYTANFNYVGGNENFDVKTNPWGAGLGFETNFKISEKTFFQILLGIDYYQEVELAGHDTSYTPEGDHINPRDGYDYSSADEAIDQPDLEILALMGLLVEF